jgi:hypothetical protein
MRLTVLFLTWFGSFFINFFLICCALCTEQRGIANRLYQDVEEGCFPDLYSKSQEMGAQQVITL